MLSIFLGNISNPFNEHNTKVTKLDLRLTNIDSGAMPELHEALVEELEKETKQIMEDADHAFLKRKQEAPTTIMSLDLVDTMASKLFTPATPSEEPPRSTTETYATAPWFASWIIIGTTTTVPTLSLAC